MSALTTTQIQSAIRRKILEETQEVVSDDTILLNANLAYDDLKISSFSNDQIKEATIALTNGEGTLPSDFGTAYGPGYKSRTTTDASLPFPEVSVMQFDQDPTIEAFVVVGGVLKVNPSTTSQIILRYFPSYDPLSSTQDPQLNSYLHELIIYGALWRIFEDMQDEAMSEFYRQKYNEMLAEKTAKLSNYQEDNMGGNSMFNYKKMF